METGERGRFRYNSETMAFEKIEKPNRIEVAAPFVTTDEIPETLSHADDRTYTSKTKLRESYKRHGYVERGDAPPMELTKAPKPDINDIRDDVAKALNDIKYGMAPMNELEKEQCLREQRAEKEYKRRNGIR